MIIQQAIERLADGADLSRDEARGALREIMRGESTPAQIAGFLVALRIRGETADVIAGCAEAMREASTPVDTGGRRVVDIVGTGGDGARTFNISTAAALVAAGAGACVAKHGSRRASSLCGSADVLQHLGVRVDVPSECMAHCLREIGIAFLFAITLHPAMKHAAGPRRELGIRTIFNILGPLANPARARHGVLGVYHAALVPVVARAAQGLGAERLWVVHGRDGLDELSLTGPSLVAEIRDGVIREFEMTPEDGGLSRHPAETLRGGDAAANAAIIRSILGGSRGAPRDIVALNAGAALLNGGQAENLRDGVALALRAIDSGAAAEKLERLVKITNEA